LAAQFGCGFGDPLEASLNRVVGFLVLPERRRETLAEGDREIDVVSRFLAR